MKKLGGALLGTAFARSLGVGGEEASGESSVEGGPSEEQRQKQVVPEPSAVDIVRNIRATLSASASAEQGQPEHGGTRIGAGTSNHSKMHGDAPERPPRAAQIPPRGSRSSSGGGGGGTGAGAAGEPRCPERFKALLAGNTKTFEEKEKLLEELSLNTTVESADDKKERHSKRVGWARKIHIWENDQLFYGMQSLLDTTAHECEKWMQEAGAEKVIDLSKVLQELEDASGEQFQCSPNIFMAPDEAYFQLHEPKFEREPKTAEAWAATPTCTSAATATAATKIRGAMEELRMPSRVHMRDVWEEVTLQIQSVFCGGEVETEEDLWDPLKLQTVIEEYVVGAGWDPKYQIECRDDIEALKPQLPSVREDIRAMIRQVVFRKILNRHAQERFNTSSMEYDIEGKVWKHPEHKELTMVDLKNADAIEAKRLFDFGYMTAQKLKELRAQCVILSDASNARSHGKSLFLTELVQALPEPPRNGSLESSKKADDFNHDDRKGVIVFLEKFEEVMTRRASIGNKTAASIFKSKELPSFFKVGKGLTLSFGCETDFDTLLANVALGRRDAAESGANEQAVVVSSFYTSSQAVLPIHRAACSSTPEALSEDYRRHNVGSVVVHEVGLSTAGLYTIEKKGGKHILEYAPLSTQAQGDGDAKSLTELLDGYETLQMTVGNAGAERKTCIFNISLNRQDWNFVGGSAGSVVVRCLHRECVGPIPEGGRSPFRRFALFAEGPLQLDQPGFMRNFKGFCNNDAFAGSAQAVRDMLCYCALSPKHVREAVSDINILVRETDPCTTSRLLYCANRDTQERLPQRTIFAAMLSSYWRKLLSVDFKEGVKVPEVPKAFLDLIRGGKSDPSVLLADVIAQRELRGYVEGKTLHEFQVMQVEPSNLEAVHTRIVECSGYGSLNILFLTLGPALSPADVCSLACASFSGSVRLIIRKTQTTIAALHEHRASGKVLVVETISGSQRSVHTAAPKLYSEASVVGATIVKVGISLTKENASLRGDEEEELCGQFVAAEVRTRVLHHQACHLPVALSEIFCTPGESKWYEVEEAFRHSVSLPGDEMDANVLLLVAEDPCLVQYYYDNEQNMIGQPSTLDALDAEFEQKFAKFQTMGMPSALPEISLQNENRQPYCVVVYRAQMLSHERKIVIVQRASQARMRLIFVVQKLDTDDLFDLLAVDESAPDQVAAAHYLFANVHSSREMCTNFMREEVLKDEATYELLLSCELVFRSIRLAFGSTISLDFLKSNPEIIEQIKKVLAQASGRSGNELAVQLLRVGSDLLDKKTVHSFSKEIIAAACKHARRAATAAATAVAAATAATATTALAAWCVQPLVQQQHRLSIPARRSTSLKGMQIEGLKAAAARGDSSPSGVTDE